MTRAYMLPDGRILAPRRAEGDGGLLGDAWLPVGADSPEGKAWLEFYAARGEEMPAAAPPGPDA